MIDLYYWTTPNGHKITLFLEEAAMPYTLKRVHIGKGEQFETEFLKISPNNRIPAMVDHAPAEGGKAISVFESGAILLYLAGKSGQFIPKDLRGQVECIEWLFWQMAGLGPMAGQNHHFANYAPQKIPYAIERYVKETSRLYAVLNKQLTGRDEQHMVGLSFSQVLPGMPDELLTGSDPDNAPLSFVIRDAPGHGTLSGTPPHLRG